MVTLLDGPLGTELHARGVVTELPLWSAGANETAPDVVFQIHRDYALAGATVHTTNTFRTRRRLLPTRWKALTERAVALARSAALAGHRVAGSIAPLEDCYRPDLSPAGSNAEHREMADALAEAGCDLLLCETFPHPGEALEATAAAVATGLETWLSLTAGPSGDLMTPTMMSEVACRARDLGVSAMLVNCIAVPNIARFHRALWPAGVATGVYANAGSADDRIGWAAAGADPARYGTSAKVWLRDGASIVGGCCGTGPAHVRAVADVVRGITEDERCPKEKG